MKTIEPILEIGEDKNCPIPKDQDYEAYCCSAKCAGNSYTIHLAHKPKATRKSTFCDDCGYALVWRKKGSKWPAR